MYYKNDKNLIIAIPPLIVATLIAVFAIYILEKKIPYVPIIGATLIAIFGGLTIILKNPIFLYLKPTIINYTIDKQLWKFRIFDVFNLLVYYIFSEKRLFFGL